MRGKGIKGLAIDYDGVIVPYHSYQQPSDLKIDKLNELHKHFVVGILSNRKGKLLESLQATLSHLPVLQCGKMKPHPEPYKNAVACLGTPIEKTAIIEDRLITGIAGAKRLGMYTIWITPPLEKENEPWNVKAYRVLEETVLYLYKKLW